MKWNFVEDNSRQLKGKVEARPDKAGKESPNEVCLMQEEVLSRRSVLRGALVVGCCLFAPAVFFSSPAAGADAAPTATTKVSKKSVLYQTHPKGEQKCATCMNFIAASNTCKRVEGPINPEGWCILWAKKA